MAVVFKDKKILESKIKSLPDAPGVYMFKDTAGKILYVGKAKSLKKRVQSYFGRYLSSKTQIMLSKVADIDYKVSPSENQAQLLEASLIKDKQPPYNVDLKDDKSFPLIRITHEEFPVVSICRRKTFKPDDKALYFGPYTNAKLLRQALRTIRRIFGFRSCNTMPKQACLYYRLNLCPAPCIKKINATDYQEIIKQIKMFLESKYDDLISVLTKRMQELAKEENFEAAIRIRDQINSLSIIGQKSLSESGLNELEDLRNLLRLKKLPLRIEAFDISNILGQEACGSMISFYKGLPDKDNYRRFRIKTVEGIDDYKMLCEIIERRYVRLIAQDLPLPDLILIDGGRAHLLTADRVIKKLGLDIPIISIAKDRENIYIKGKKSPISFNQDTPALNLIRRIRDEAHRFAITYHRILRRKKIIGK